jgi:cysteinyl-tRNA synthetase
VLFSVPSMPDYGRLSKRPLDEMIAGARVDVAPYKRDPMDFVLWKPSKPGEPAWPSPSGIKSPGRPGWHIECSAMSWKHLGETFDIHGGGIDLVFPHHENEIAQSRCAFHTPVMANYWLHNGFLQVEGAKMSKSEGNFVTIRELLDTTSFGSNKWHGRVLRLAMLMTHYRQPIDWTVDRLVEARSTLREWIDAVEGFEVDSGAPSSELLDALTDDLNFPGALGVLHSLYRAARPRMDAVACRRFGSSLAFLGLWGGEMSNDVFGYGIEVGEGPAAADVEALIAQRNVARKEKKFHEADRIRDELAAMGVTLKDSKDGTTWEIAR